VGALAHLLKNRFYIGEVVYRGAVHRGEHEPILDSALFAAVQGKLAAQAVARRWRLRGPSALLTGRIFDAYGNRMSPTHANKRGARYRYYISRAVLQKKPQVPGSVGRVAAAELEALVLAALRHHLNASGTGEQLPGNDRDLVERQLERVTLTSNEIKLRLREMVEEAPQALCAHESARWRVTGGLRVRLCVGTGLEHRMKARGQTAHHAHYCPFAVYSTRSTLGRFGNRPYESDH
jgi:site-specific DNA recombinase